MLRDNISQSSGSLIERKTAFNTRTQARKFQWIGNVAAYFAEVRSLSRTKENGADWDGMEPFDVLRGWRGDDQ